MKLPFLKPFIQLCLMLLLGVFSAQDRGIPAKPSGMIMPVYDAVDKLSSSEEAALNQKLMAFQQRSSSEILVVLTDTTHGEDINFFATLWGEKWGIGERKQDNGVVLMLAFEDRKISIQPGRGVEQYITAAQAGQIIDYAIKPNIKKSPYKAIDKGTDYIISAMEGKFKAPEKRKKDKDESSGAIFIILGIVLLVIILARRKNGNNGGYTIGGGGFFPGTFGGGFGSGSGSNDSDSGFGGFGDGGSFGGGGASGSWD